MDPINNGLDLAKYCMDVLLIRHIREPYAFKCHSHDTDNPTQMEDLSCEHTDEYYKSMDDGIQSIMRRDT